MRIRTRGDIHGGFMLMSHRGSACGDIRGGVSIRMGDRSAGFVASWADLEAAYLAAKAYRETDEFRAHVARQIEQFGPGDGEWSTPQAGKDVKP